MLINLSNHPIASWNEKQISAAMQYGELVEIPFPQIMPDASEKDINRLAAEYVDKIKSLGANNGVTIHVMGEMTFTMRIVHRLKSLGYTCLASTSERKVKDLGNGKKEVTFEFVQFREY